ncbi:MAG TPA: hypothetical protein PLM14_07975 [Candidatus Hydrogenedentes bacterium]|nr:hypothetical protein [Candidatus Hydrogenedentota bacterium]
MRLPKRSKREGIALLTATIFLALAMLILAYMTSRVVTQNSQVNRYVQFKDCFQGLESAYAASVVDLELGNDGMIGLGTWDPYSEGPFTLPTFDADDIAPVQVPNMPGVQFMAAVEDWDNDGIDNNGDGIVDGIEENRVYTLHLLANNAGVQRRAEVVVKATDVNVWRNAIFGGTGQSGGLINGNVSIHGSVHLLGTDILPGGLAVAAIDLSGTSLIHNNYGSLIADLRNRVPALPQRTWNGETIETLNAKLRVKNGLVGMSGNSEIGEPDVFGNAYKETMDGTYVNDGWTGNSVVIDGGRGDPTAVFSDNGWDDTYELGDKVTLPLFSSDWRDPITGSTVLNPNTGVNYTHAEYFATISSTPYTGNIVIDARTTNFYYNATRPGDTNPANRQPTDDYILFNCATNLLQINGQVQINGNLSFTGQGNDKSINYTGRAALLVHGDVSIETDLLAVNANGTTVGSFPAANCLGLMASNNMDVGMTAQLKIMGGFYAQNRVRSQKQTIVMGTFVSNYFDMGTNVPDIYQVPALADNLPYGMIGAYPILTFLQVSWRELGTDV